LAAGANNLSLGRLYHNYNLVCLRNNFRQFKRNRVSKEKFHLLFYNGFTFISPKARQSQFLGTTTHTASVKRSNKERGSFTTSLFGLDVEKWQPLYRQRLAIAMVFEKVGRSFAYQAAVRTGLTFPLIRRSAIKVTNIMFAPLGWTDRFLIHPQ
jgi:hypothetical protein